MSGATWDPRNFLPEHTSCVRVRIWFGREREHCPASTDTTRRQTAMGELTLWCLMCHAIMSFVRAHRMVTWLSDCHRTHTHHDCCQVILCMHSLLSHTSLAALSPQSLPLYHMPRSLFTVRRYCDVRSCFRSSIMVDTGTYTDTHHTSDTHCTHTHSHFSGITSLLLNHVCVQLAACLSLNNDVHSHKSHLHTIPHASRHRVQPPRKRTIQHRRRTCPNSS